jgi:predicted nuclease with RNAse H fold
VSRIVGVDLAASSATTAFAVLVDEDEFVLHHVEVGADDDRLLDACRDADKIGIDCPLGWPTAFVEFVAAHRDGRPLAAAATTTDRLPLVYRETDRRVAAHYPPLRPLSVAADRIGHAALRCAGLLARLGETDRSGIGRVVEVYPAASLHVWGLRARGYKRVAGRTARDRLVDGIAATIRLGAQDRLCRESDHALDAVVAALSALAAVRGAATLPGDADAATARVEGWIAVPTCSLADVRVRS